MSNFKDYIELANEMINEGKKNRTVIKEYDKNKKQKYEILLNDASEKETKKFILINSNKENNYKNDIKEHIEKFLENNNISGDIEEIKSYKTKPNRPGGPKSPFIYKVTFK